MGVTGETDSGASVNHSHYAHVDDRIALQEGGLRATLEETVEDKLRRLKVLRGKEALRCPAVEARRFMTAGVEDWDTSCKVVRALATQAGEQEQGIGLFCRCLRSLHFNNFISILL